MIYTRAQIVDGTGFAQDARFEDYSDYNGWRNRETWAVGLWINNDQGMQESVYELLREAVGEVVVGDTGYEQQDVPLLDWQAGDIVREYVEELFDLDTHDGVIPRDVWLMAQDIGSLYRVDWREIGANFLSAIAEDDQ